MNPGLLDRKIIILRQAAGLFLVDESENFLTDSAGARLITESRKDRFGAELDNWITWKTRRARKIENAGRETQQNARELGRQGVIFRIRYTPGITLEDRVLFDDLNYDIDNIIEIGRRMYHDLECILRSDLRPA